MPPVYQEVEISFFLLRRLLGQKATDGGKQAKVNKLTKGEGLMVNIGSTSTGATVKSVKGDTARLVVVQPVCTEMGEKIALSRKVERHWRLIGWGQIKDGKEVDIEQPTGVPGLSE